MNFIDTLTSADLVLATETVPLIVGESGIGKTDLAKELARQKNWSLITIDANLLKEGEIGGLPTVKDNTTVYAVHHKLKELEKAAAQGETVLLFIDEMFLIDIPLMASITSVIRKNDRPSFTISRIGFHLLN